MCFNTCSSSFPSTNRILRPGISAHLYVVTGYNCQFLFGEHGWDDVITSGSQVDERPFFRRFGSGFLESFNRVPAVGCGEDLDVQLLRQAENHPPNVGLYGIMQPILELVNQQNPLTSALASERAMPKRRFIPSPKERRGTGLDMSCRLGQLPFLRKENSLSRS